MTSKTLKYSLQRQRTVVRDQCIEAQDRIEIRERQEAVFRLTYLVIPGLIGIAAFSVGHPAFKGILVIGEALLLALYVIAFFTFRNG